MKHYIIMGPPASGKGTLSKQLAEKYGLDHISTGEILRKERDAGTKIGKMADALINAGKYVPDDIIIAMVKEHIISSSNKEGFIYDGFPRTQDQAKQLHAFLLHRRTPITSIIHLDTPKQVTVERIRKRRLEENRQDDDESVIETRFEQYQKLTEPVLEFFSKKDMVNTIDGSKDKGEVLKDVLTLFEK
jgi:adenylate kinase